MLRSPAGFRAAAAAERVLDGRFLVERFVATQPTNAVHSRELKVVSVAFLLDEASRFLVQGGKFAELRVREASRYGSLAQLEVQEREMVIGYLQAQVPLTEFRMVA